MKLNREKITLLLALAIGALGVREVVLGVMAPTGSVATVDPTVSRSSHDVVPRRHRKYTSSGATRRNPFTFSEGWEALEAPPLEMPPLPAAPRPLPGFIGGAGILETGTVFVERPAPAKGAAAKRGGSS